MAQCTERLPECELCGSGSPGVMGISIEKLPYVSSWPPHTFTHVYPTMCPHTFTHTKNRGKG